MFLVVLTPLLCAAQTAQDKEGEIPQAVSISADYFLQNALLAARNTAIIYYKIDPIEMLDAMTRVGGSGPKEECYYRFVLEECDALSYFTCKAALELNAVNPSLLKNVRKIYARPAQGNLLLNPKGEDFFYSPSGKLYPAWNYHAAALLTFEYEGKTYETILDKFLLEKPISLKKWKTLFSTETKFIIKDFKPSPKIDSTFTNINNLPKNCLPHPVSAPNIDGYGVLGKTNRNFNQ